MSRVNLAETRRPGTDKCPGVALVNLSLISCFFTFMRRNGSFSFVCEEWWRRTAVCYISDCVARLIVDGMEYLLI